MGLEFLYQYEGITLERIIWCIFFAVTIASIVIWYQRRVLGTFVRALLERQAHEEETALTIAQTAVKYSLGVRLALGCRRSTFRRIVSAVGDRDEDAKNKKLRRYCKVLPTAPAFYISPEMTDRARALYSAEGSGGGVVLLTVVVAFLFTLLAVQYGESFLALFDHMFS